MKRKSKQLLTCAIFLALMAVFACLWALPASAQDIVRFGGEIQVPEGEQVKSTVVLFGPTHIDGEVWEGVVNIFGPAEVNGIAESVVVVGGSAAINGTAQDVVVVGGSATISGQVGDLVVVGGSLHLDSTAQINGDLVVIGGSLDRDSGAVIRGDVVNMTLKQVLSGQLGEWFRGYPFHRHFFASFWWRLGNLFMLAIVLVIVSILFPGATIRSSDELAAHPLQSFLWGILIALLAVPTTILLFITILGIPLAGLLWLALACTYYLGYTGLSSLVGSKILTAFGSKQPDLFLTTLTGIVTIGLITWLPWIGFVIGVLLKTTALGAAAVSLINSRRQA